MSSIFEVSLENANAELARLLKPYSKVDFTPIMRVIGEQLVAAVDDEFESSGRGRWPPLAPSTLGKGKWSGPPKVGSRRDAKAKAAFYETRGNGGSEREATAAARKAGGMRYKTRGSSFANADRVGSAEHDATRAAYYEAIGGGATHEEAMTAAHKRAQHGGILHDTGALAGSIHSESGPDFAMATTDKFYAVFHVSSAPRSIIPLRDFFDVPEDVYEEAANTLLEAIAE
jgi:phage gpG-like protein